MAVQPERELRLKRTWLVKGVLQAWEASSGDCGVHLCELHQLALDDCVDVTCHASLPVVASALIVADFFVSCKENGLN